MYTRETMFSLTGKTAIVTGGSRGIGKVVAGHLAMMGADIAIVNTNAETGAQAAEEIGNIHKVKTKSYVCDVTKPNEVESTINQIASDFGGLDVLFNNAGICLHKAALEVSPEEWMRIFGVNTHGVFFMSRAFAKKLIELERPGSIINNASMSAEIVNLPQEQVSYNASKAAVVHMTRSMAVEWVKHDIRVNCISPGYIATDMSVLVRKDWTAKWEDMTPYGRMGNPEELSGAVIYLASDCSTFTSGANIVIDGLYSAV